MLKAYAESTGTIQVGKIPSKMKKNGKGFDQRSRARTLYMKKATMSKVTNPNGNYRKKRSFKLAPVHQRSRANRNTQRGR